MDSNAKLAEIQQLAREYNKELIDNNSVRDEISSQGGCLFLSTPPYAQVPIFIHYKPGAVQRRAIAMQRRRRA